MIAERPVYSNTIGSTISHISEFTSGAKVLTKEIEKCIPQFRDVKPMSPFACVVPAMPQQISKISLSRSKGSIYVNRTEFINQSAKAQYNVFNAMIEAFLYDFQNGTTTYLKIYQLADILNESGSDVVISEEQIRRTISRIKKLFEQMDILPEKVFDQTYGLGYRLNHENVNLEI